MEASMMRYLLLSFLVGIASCGTSGDNSSASGDAGSDGQGGGRSDAAGSDGQGGGRSDAGGDDAPTQDASEDAADGANSCPVHQPRDGDACTGTASCQYGHTVCCGIDYSLFTCKCQQGSFSCAMTVECNVVCSDGGAPADAPAE
jgi:hypothetical protein